LKIEEIIMASRFPAPPPVVAPAPRREVVSTFWTWVALLFVLIGVAGSLYMSMGLGLIACPLCFYQRTLAMAVAAVLLVGLLAGPRRSGFLSLVTLPLTVGALGIAGIHVYKEFDNVLECPDGVICELYKQAKGEDDIYQEMHEVVTGPKESLTLLTLLFLVQVVDVLRSGKRGGFGWVSLFGVVILGVGMTAGTYLCADDPSKIPQWPEPIKGCRPPPKL
jgi:disulfide bond formation protein DsbB